MARKRLLLWRYEDYKEHDRNRMNRKKTLEKRIAKDGDYFNELLSTVLNDGMLDMKVLEAILQYGGDEFVTNMVQPHKHNRTFKAQKQLIKQYKRSESIDKQ